MSDIVNALSNQPGFIATGAASRAEIHEAETALSLRFASEYADYLTRYGCVSFVGHELTGLFHSSRLNVVDATVRGRKMLPEVSSKWYVLEETHIDGVIIWQSSTGEIYQTTPGSSAVKIANSLCEYLGLEES